MAAAQEGAAALWRGVLRAAMACAVIFGNVYTFTVVMVFLLLFALAIVMVVVGVIRKIRFERRESRKESKLLALRDERIREEQEKRASASPEGAAIAPEGAAASPRESAPRAKVDEDEPPRRDPAGK